FKHIVLGPTFFHLDLSLEDWAADGLLAIFFFVAGLELKRELVVGSLRDRHQAVLPVVAALAGMIAPACIFLAFTAHDDLAREGWGIPMATDIAFALAVLAVVGSHLPPALRAFLLTLAVVDDMGAIAVIAFFFTDRIALIPLVIAIVLLVVYFLLQRARVTSAWLYVPLGFSVWALMHESGIHATVAGVLLGLLTRVKPDPDESASPAERLEHRIRPLSAGVAVPAFAFLSAGVTFSLTDFFGIFGDVAVLGIVFGLVIGKLVGVFGASWLTTRLTGAELDPSVSWFDMVGLALLSGIGFTVSLLIAELAYTHQPERLADAKIAILLASLVAALLAAVVLQLRDRAYRRAAQVDTSG
ncbi:MAG TPA: Na+/H+ antiporter NhaA, partial [Actinomycetes bacterium]|nr:Na+/H+ antiporter NhaA [Actinomycetes bacterium]